MKNKTRLFSLLLIVGTLLAGCCICPKNQKAGFARIHCQPEDVVVREGSSATFEVEAEGANLVYQWFFKNDKICAEPVGANTTGGDTPKLTIPTAALSDVGFYWAEITSTDPLGGPVRIRTRDAALGIEGTSAPLIIPLRVMAAYTATNPIPPPLSQPPITLGMVAAGPFPSGPCGGYCGYVNFNRDGSGALFGPLSGHTRAVIKIRVGGPTAPYYDNTKYEVRWRVSSTEAGCALNLTGSTIEKWFQCAYPKKYAFTVYFKSPCPAANVPVSFEVTFM